MNTRNILRLVAKYIHDDETVFSNKKKLLQTELWTLANSMTISRGLAEILRAICVSITTGSTPNGTFFVRLRNVNSDEWFSFDIGVVLTQSSAMISRFHTYTQCPITDIVDLLSVSPSESKRIDIPHFAVYIARSYSISKIVPPTREVFDKIPEHLGLLPHQAETVERVRRVFDDPLIALDWCWKIHAENSPTMFMVNIAEQLMLFVLHRHISLQWALIGNPSGSGKTRCAVVLANEREGHVLIVTKIVAHVFWEAEIRAVLPPTEAAAFFARTSICTLEKFSRTVVSILQQSRATKPAPVHPFMPFDPSVISYSTVVIDDAHCVLRNPDNQCSQILRAFWLSQGNNARLLLLTHSLTDIPLSVFGLDNTTDTGLRHVWQSEIQTRQCVVVNNYDYSVHFPELRERTIEIVVEDADAEIQKSLHHVTKSTRAEHDKFVHMLFSGIVADTPWWVAMRLKAGCALCGTLVGHTRKKLLPCLHMLCDICCDLMFNPVCPRCKMAVASSETLSTTVSEKVHFYQKVYDKKVEAVRDIVYSHTGGCILLLSDYIEVCVELETRLLGSGLRAFTSTLAQKTKDGIAQSLVRGTAVVATVFKLVQFLPLERVDCVVLWAPSSTDVLRSRFLRLGSVSAVIEVVTLDVSVGGR